jgi:predicted MFS family arabinose efflux permease
MTGVLNSMPKHALVILPLLGLPASLLVIPLVESPLALAGAGALYGLSHGILSPVLVSTFLSRASDARQGRMSTLFQLLFNLGTFGAANVGGLLAEIQVHWTFMAAGTLALLGAVAALTRLRRLGIR